MKALMLAAGVGRRLFGNNNDDLPKVLLKFKGQSLLERHIELLQAQGVDELVLIVGHGKEDLVAEAIKFSGDGFVKWIENPRYQEGPILSLAQGEKVLRSGSNVLFMDSDVLYHPLILEKLIVSPEKNCFIFDQVFQSDEDPVKLCLKEGLIVDFGKVTEEQYDTAGEWPGFMKMEGRVAGLLMDAVEKIIASGEIEGSYERAITAVLKSEPLKTFGYEDVTNIPWIEIDDPSDLEKAISEIFPRISDYLVEATTENPSPKI